MSNTIDPKVHKKVKMPFTIEALIQILNNIRLKSDAAAGAATALELRLRIIAELEPNVQIALKRQKKPPYFKADLIDLIDAVIEVFQDKLDPMSQDKIKSCRPPRNKVAHGSFAELMIELNGEALGRDLDGRTGKYNPIEKGDIVEGVICIERNRGLESFTLRANEAIEILEQKILRSLKP